MPYKLTSFPEFDAVHSDNQGDDHRIPIMKGALLSELVQQPCIVKVFAHWGVATGLFNLADELGNASDRLAKALKLPDRTALNSDEVSKFDVATLSKRTRDLVATREAAVARFGAELQSLARTVGPDAEKVAEQIGLPYRWVEQGLLHGFGGGMAAIAAGQEIVFPLPQIVVTSDGNPRRRGRRSDASTIGRYAQWYVQHRISGVSANELARQYHETFHRALHHTHTWKHDRKTIRDGIAEVERLLKLTR